MASGFNMNIFLHVKSISTWNSFFYIRVRIRTQSEYWVHLFNRSINSFLFLFGSREHIYILTINKCDKYELWYFSFDFSSFNINTYGWHEEDCRGCYLKWYNINNQSTHSSKITIANRSRARMKLYIYGDFMNLHAF